MYQVRFYKGDYRERQKAANKDRAVCYVEHHLNSSNDQYAGYATAIVATNCSQKSLEWARWYSHRVGQEFVVKVGGDDGVVVGGYRGRGNANLKYTAMPAILVEPLFASNPNHTNIIRTEWGQERLAKVLVESIVKYFPGGGIVAFSVGHKYKVSNPHDLGAKVYGGGAEADFSERVLMRAAEMLG
jgi:N-acetylmuramoyl-L-alanine amidase